MRQLALTLIAVATFAELARADAPSVVPHIQLTIIGGAAAADVVEERVTSWFRAQQTVVSATRLDEIDPAAVLAPKGSVGVQVWIVLRDPAVGQVFFTVRERVGQAPRYLVTDIVLDTGLDEIGIERLAQVVYPSALALWAGTVESSRDDVEQVLRQRPDEPRAFSPPVFLLPGPVATTPRSLVLGAEYGVTFPGVGVAHTISATARLRWLRVRLTGILPYEASASGVAVDLAGGSAALGATASHDLARGRSVTGELGAAVQLVHYSAGELADPSLVPTAGSFAAEPVVFGRAGVRFEVGPLIVGLEATVDVHLNRTHYDVMTGGAQRPVVVPWPVQPGAAAGVMW